MIILILIGFLVVYLIVVYNGFVSLRHRARNAWSDIDVQLKRRYDLVPNLVETVKGYAAHEKAVFEDVAKLRAQAMESKQADQRGEDEAKFGGAIRTLFAVAESYPDLRADRNFRDLQSQLAEIEDHIQYARRYYNAVVRDFNIKREVFPTGIIGGWFGFQKLSYFQIEEDEREPAKVEMKVEDKE